MTSVAKLQPTGASNRASAGSKRGATTTTDIEEPDSTTVVEKESAGFCPGQDVLLKQKDGRYYLGTVVEVDNIREQCLVKFGDNTDSWSTFKDLTKLTTPQQEDLLCVVCKKWAPQSKREITVCDKCGRGYHQKCHQPEIPLDCQSEESSWMCRRCLGGDSQRLKKGESKHGTKREHGRISTSSTSDGIPLPIPCTKVLPYDLNSLTWDTYHRVNDQHVYCYCGDVGEWYRQMVQCGRCKQWFHEQCIDCLQYPLYCGDRFYVFICAICNHGLEFLRRLEIKWVDLVHLMLFNLTAFNFKKYYDLDTTIIPYINDNWHALQLPPKIISVCKSDRRESILSVLTNNRNRFKCGREIKKRTTIWGLRVRLPPPAPTINFTFSGRICEEQLRETWQGNRRLQFLSLEVKTEFDRKPYRKIVPSDGHMRNIMSGSAYLQNCNPSETDSPCPSPDGDLDDGAHRMVVVDERLYKGDYVGAGCAKKSAPYTNMGVQKRKRLMSVSGRDRDRVLRRPRRRNTNDGISRNDGEGGYITRLSLDNKNCKSSETPPLTPPTSVSAPPTPPASNSTALLSDLSNDYPPDQLTDSKPKLKYLDSNLELNTPCDTSGDETSSKSTLDLIIPPPKDFEGKNNPFLALLRSGQDDAPKKRKDSITLPLPLTAVIPGKPVMRPKKRQLSEKDIFVGPNGEVKRRRPRRNRGQFSSYVAGQTASKTAAVVPARPDDKEWGARNNNNGQQGASSSSVSTCVDYAFNGRKLRQRPDKSSISNEVKEKQVSPKPSPVKNEPDISMDDLKSSVNIYFGAANRIASGELFTVKAQRIGPGGKLEFLIEWDGPGNGMT